MKVCDHCMRINPEDAEVCIECTDDGPFTPLSFILGDEDGD